VLSESQAGLGEAIQVRGLKSLLAIATEVAVTQVVGEDENDVGALSAALAVASTLVTRARRMIAAVFMHRL
jgi:hypothetical protein